MVSRRNLFKGFGALTGAALVLPKLGLAVPKAPVWQENVERKIFLPPANGWQAPIKFEADIAEWNDQTALEFLHQYDQVTSRYVVEGYVDFKGSGELPQCGDIVEVQGSNGQIAHAYVTDKICDFRVAGVARITLKLTSAEGAVPLVNKQLFHGLTVTRWQVDQEFERFHDAYANPFYHRRLMGR